MTLGMRAQTEFIHQFTGSKELPIFEKLFLGGEYNIRGFDIRTIGPQDPATGLVLGGNKLLLFNAEEQITIAGPVRAILFFDAGQVRDVGQSFGWKENVVELVPPLLFDPLAAVSLTGLNAIFPQNETRITGQRAAFKTSTGLEIRFFMPVLNVPFRLIFAYNPSRAGVLDNTLQPQKKFQFRFAVGSTF
jgi:outer membrane protein assembly factor BamA